MSAVVASRSHRCCGVNSSIQRLKQGAVFELAGKRFSFNFFKPQSTSLECVEGLSVEDRVAIEHYIEFTRNQVAPIVQRIADRLVDPFDGVISHGAHTLAQHIGSLEKDDFESVAPYILHLTKMGTHYQATKGCNIPPPISRIRFEQLLNVVPHHLWSDQSRQEFLDAIYDPTPRITEGYYLFKTPGDFARFEESLGARYKTFKKVIEHLYAKASISALSPDEWRGFYQASKIMGEIQGKKLLPILDKNSLARLHNTRVYIGVDLTGDISLQTVHYRNEFHSDWDKLSSVLLRSAALLPHRCGALKRLLSEFAVYVISEENSSTWGESLPSWVAYREVGNVLDVNFCCEETDSSLGSKAVPQLVINQFINPPNELTEVWQRVIQDASKKSIYTHMFKMLLGAGGFSHFVMHGEKLPNPSTRPQFKAMTFANCITQGTFLGHVEHFAKIFNCSSDDILSKFEYCPIIGVALHEYGHTLGGRQEDLGPHALTVEETNAQASVPYLAARFRLSTLKELLLYECIWMPVHRATQGVQLAHSRSDLVLLDEYHKAGAIVIDTGSEPQIKINDVELVTLTAFAVAIKTRLWEYGIPTRLQGEFLEAFDVNDMDQDKRIIEHAREWLSRATEVEAMRSEVRKELEVYYDAAKFSRLAATLQPIIAQLPEAKPYDVMPNHAAICALMAQMV